MSEKDLEFRKEKEDRYSNISNVDENEYLIPEEFPEGSFGSPINADEAVFSKSTPWQKGQRRQSAFVYPDKDRHDDLPRQTPGSHPIHDEE
ncbi:hypothetical protein ACLIBG_06915 [Virgibacillus sp. W0181]|uniref:hypothetical protein n=1 Tax=Virgibacillus sp. W0181 TaxID=3391581 RepID=UPI003F44D6D0